MATRINANPLGKRERGPVGPSPEIRTHVFRPQTLLFIVKDTWGGVTCPCSQLIAKLPQDGPLPAAGPSVASVAVSASGRIPLSSPSTPL